MSFGLFQKKLQTPESVPELRTYIEQEITSYRDFEQALLPILREVRDAETNLKVLIDQMESLNKLVATREETLKKIAMELGKPPAEVSVESCRQYQQMLGHLDEEIKPLLDKMREESGKLQINETHILYAETENQGRMKKVHTDAVGISHDLEIIIGRLNGAQKIERQYHKKIYDIEKTQKLPSQTEKIGFT